MRTGRGPIGVIGIDNDKTGPLLTPDQRRLLDALVDQGALAIERVLWSKTSIAQAHRRYRPPPSALLTSISHDLKTPLASVLGAASTLRDLGRPDEAQKNELLATMIDESERLNRFIANLLDMTKLESGAIGRTRRSTMSARSSAARLRRAGKILAYHKVSLELVPDLPMLELDAVLFEQVLSTCSTTPPNTRRRTPPSRSGGHGTRIVSLQILDEGNGIPAAELESVFDKFYRAQKGDHVRPGTGLGLAISRGFVEAMGGKITAANRSDRSGAVLTIRLPVPAATNALDTAA